MLRLCFWGSSNAGDRINDCIDLGTRVREIFPSSLLSSSPLSFHLHLLCICLNSSSFLITLPPSTFKSNWVLIHRHCLDEDGVASGGFRRILEMYIEIKEKGVFWGFDQLVEKGYVNYAYGENEIRMSKMRPPWFWGFDQLDPIIIAIALDRKPFCREEDEREEGKNSVIENSQKLA
ncbi:hypothetical protein L1887_31354 [Cichorium endivia]|nr:hypothetical protein L1887_31354 [Cichorium endivia]